MRLSMIRASRTLYPMTWDRLLLCTEGHCRVDALLRHLQERRNWQFFIRPLTSMRCIQHWGLVSSAPRQQLGCERWAAGVRHYHGTRAYSGGPAGGVQEDRRSLHGESLRTEPPLERPLDPPYSLQQKPGKLAKGHQTNGQPVASTSHRTRQGNSAAPPALPKSRRMDSGRAQATGASSEAEADIRGAGSGQAPTAASVTASGTAKLPEQSRGGLAQGMARTQEGHGGFEPGAASHRGAEDGKTSSSAGEGKTPGGLANYQGPGPVEDGVRQAGSAAGESLSDEANQRQEPVKKWPARKRGRKKGMARVNPFLPKLKPLTPEEELLPLTEEFKTRLKELEAYKQVFGDCLVPRKFWDNPALGEWCTLMRVKAREQSLSQQQIAALEAVEFPWKADGRAIQWNFNYHELRRWAVEHGSIDVPFKWKDPTGDFSNEFAKWYHTQPTLFLQRRLHLDQVRKLLLVGYDVRKITGDDISREEYDAEHKKVMRTGGKAEFELMYKELVAWKEKYYTCVVPKQVYDNPVLGMWVHELRKKAKEKKMDDETYSRLDAIGFCWTVDQQSAKWHHILHEARRYREVHGTGFVPIGYNNPKEPGWIEAARWIQKNAKNFRKGKLSDKKYAMIRDIVGIKFVKEYGPGPEELVPGKIKGSKRKVPVYAVPKYDPSTRRVDADGVWDGY